MVGDEPGRARARVLQINQHEFGRPAADVEHDHGIGLPVDEIGATDRGQGRLGLAGDDFKPHPGLVLDSRDELAAILGLTAGLGGDHPRPPDAVPDDLVAADGQRIDSAAHRFLGQASALAQAFAKTDDPRKGIDDAKPAHRRRRDQKPAVVGAKIECGIGRRAAIAVATSMPMRRSLGRGL